MSRNEPGKTYDYQSYKKNKGSGKKVLKKKKPGRGKFFLLLIVLLMLLMLPTIYNKLLTDEINTSILYTGKIEDSVNINAFVLRKETILESDFEGIIIPSFNEGAKVSRNSVVARISGENTENFLDEINRLNRQIITAQLETGNNSEAFGIEIERMDEDISGRVREMAVLINRNDYSGLKRVTGEIESLMVKRAEMIFGDGNDDAYVRSLKQQKNELEKHLEEITHRISSASSGIVSYVIDGYEKYMEENFINMTYSEFDRFVAAVKNNDLNDLNTDIHYVKVIDDDYWTLVFAADRRRMGNIRHNDMISIQINETGRVLRSRVDKVVSDDSGNYLVFAVIDRYLNELSSYRRLDINVIRSTHEGLMVPVDSLIGINNVNNTANIAIVKFNFASIRQVRILGRNDHHAIIENTDRRNGVSLYDTYIVNPKNIYDGQVISR